MKRDHGRDLKSAFGSSPACESNAESRSFARAVHAAIERGDMQAVSVDQLRHWRPLQVTVDRSGLGWVILADTKHDRGERAGWKINFPNLRRTLSPDDYAVVDFLFDELRTQSFVARYAMEMAGAEADLQKKRIAGGKKAGLNSARPGRPRLEQLMRAKLRLGENPRDYFGEWAREFEYKDTRQLRNILATVKKKDRRTV